MFSFFDYEHWQKVKQARAEQGLNRLSELDRARPDHPLVNKLITKKESGEAWNVVSVKEDWWYGRFLTALLERNGSHTLCMIENISCIDPGILQNLDKFKREFDIA